MLFLLFQLDTDRYALPARDVTEVLPLVAMKHLPGAPPGVVGLVNYRGQTVPAIDLALLALGRPSAQRVSTRMLILNYPHPNGRARLLGVIVERATEMIAKDPADFRPIGITTSAARYLGPVAHDPRGMLQRIDVAALLTAELQAALFPEDAAPVPGPEAVAP